MTESVYFVYRKALKGSPTPEKWFGDQTTGQGTFKEKVSPEGPLVAFFTLPPDQVRLTLDELSAKYPYIEKEEVGET